MKMDVRDDVWPGSVVVLDIAGAGAVWCNSVLVL